MSAKQQQPQDSTDDLDGLDDVLDEFNNAGSSSSSSSKPAPASSSPTTTAGKSSALKYDNTSAPSSSTTTAPVNLPEGAVPASLSDNVTEEDDLLSEAFAAQFAASMEALMKDFAKDMPGSKPAESGTGTGTGAKGSGSGGEEDAKEVTEDELIKQFEKMLSASMEGGAAASSSTASSSTAATAAGKPANFQDAIAASMARLKASDASASTTAQSGNQDPMAAMLSALASAAGDGPGDPMQEVLKALQNPDGLPSDGSGEEGLAKMLENMMEELMSREVLQEPMNDMKAKYPEFFKTDKFKALPSSDQERFRKQHQYVCQILTLFEDPAWDDSLASQGNTGKEADAQRERRKKVQELMNEMQDCGAPPDEIVGEMPPELEGIMGGAGGPGGEDCCVM